MLVMCFINAADNDCRPGLRKVVWPYNDLVPGNYLAGLVFQLLVIVALATSARSRVAGVASKIRFHNCLIDDR